MTDIHMPNRSASAIRWKALLSSFRRDKWLYAMMLPGIFWVVLFKYVPMYGITISLRDYDIFTGYSGAAWVGFEWFSKLFQYPAYWRAFENTVIISMMKLFMGFPVPIILSLMINEIRMKSAKKVVQTVVLLPNFISWVVIATMMHALFSTQTGVVRAVADVFGYQGQLINILTHKPTFRLLLTVSDIWKSAGYTTILYLGVLTSVDMTLFEAASIDGATWLRKLWHIALPAMRPTIVILLIMRMGNTLNISFDQIFVLKNSLVSDVSEILSTYVYSIGLEQRQYSIATAASLFQSIIGLVLVVASNHISNRLEPGSGLL